MPSKADLCRLTGKLPATLANAVSDAIHAAIEAGMDLDEAVCVTAAVAADYGRGEYGDGYLMGLTRAILARAGDPLPPS